MSDIFDDLGPLCQDMSPVQLYDPGDQKGRTSWSGPEPVDGKFLRGPIPFSWLTPAAADQGKAAILVGLAIWYLKGLKNSNKVVLTSAACQLLNINRKLKKQGLERLEQAGLISVTRREKKNPTVEIILQDRTQGDSR